MIKIGRLQRYKTSVIPAKAGTQVLLIYTGLIAGFPLSRK